MLDAGEPFHEWRGLAGREGVGGSNSWAGKKDETLSGTGVYGGEVGIGLSSSVPTYGVGVPTQGERGSQSRGSQSLSCLIFIMVFAEWNGLEIVLEEL